MYGFPLKREREKATFIHSNIAVVFFFLRTLNYREE